MTNLTTVAPATLRRPTFSTIKPPRLGVGMALVRILEDFGHALDLAYVQPYRLGRNPSPVVLEGNEKGRNPNW